MTIPQQFCTYFINKVSQRLCVLNATQIYHLMLIILHILKQINALFSFIYFYSRFFIMCVNIFTHSRYNHFLVLVIKLTYNKESFSLLNLIQINSTSVEVRAVGSGVKRFHIDIHFTMCISLKFDDYRFACRAFLAFKSVGVSSDTSTFCSPRASTPERNNNEIFK